jgi:hypothetical protein
LNATPALSVEQHLDELRACYARLVADTPCEIGIPLSGTQRPRKIDRPVPLATRCALDCNGARRDPLRMGLKPSREAVPVFRRCEPTFGPAERTDATRAFMGPDAGAFSPPRPRFARSRVPPAFSPASSNRVRQRFRLRWARPRLKKAAQDRAFTAATQGPACL